MQKIPCKNDSWSIYICKKKKENVEMLHQYFHQSLCSNRYDAAILDFQAENFCLLPEEDS